MATHTRIQHLINQNYLRYHKPHHFVTQGKNAALPTVAKPNIMSHIYKTMGKKMNRDPRQATGC